VNKVIIISHTTDLSKTAKKEKREKQILKPKLNMSGGIIGGGKRIIK
jgi:hypothetical protein